jgi:hypothetical protein
MEHYVTLFDGLFLPQGLALHASMERHAGIYTLWILCVDDAAHQVLSRLDLPHVRLLRAADCETPELLNVKGGRTRAEYCWTLTPFAPRFVFDADPSVLRVTYLDADMWFCDRPQRLFREFETSGKAVMITEHSYAPEYDHSRTSGRFCVQFMTFDRTRGERVRQWWADRCIEWCFAREEDGKFGDQRYLDDWPQRFPDEVHVLEDRPRLQAPWNALRFAPGEAIAFHFHGLRLLRNGHVLLTENYRLPRATRETIYFVYVRELAMAIKRLREAGHDAAPQSKEPLARLRLRIAARRIVGWWREATAVAICRL